MRDRIMPGNAGKRNNIKGRGNAPLYQLIADKLWEDIAAGNYPVDANLPIAPELAAQFGADKHTISKALLQLKDAGIISIRRRGGSRVEGAFSKSPDRLLKIFKATSGYSLDFQLRIQHKETIIAQRESATLLQCPPGQAWYHFTGAPLEAGPPGKAGGHSGSVYKRRLSQSL